METSEAPLVGASLLFALTFGCMYGILYVIPEKGNGYA